MMLKITWWTIFANLYIAQYCLGLRQYGIQSLKVECEYDKKLVKDVVCEIKFIKTGLANFTTGATLLNDANEVTMRFQTLLKKNKKFVPHLVAVSYDVCSLHQDGTDPNNFLRNLLPNFKDVFGSILQSCPYSGRVMFENYEIDGAIVSKFLTPGTYRFDYRLSNGANETYIYIKYYAILNRKARKV